MPTKQWIDQGMSFSEYFEFFEFLVDNKTTSTEHLTPAIVEYTKLNYCRTKRILKTCKLNPQNIKIVNGLEKQYWLVLTEPWCGDSGNILPIINLLAVQNDKIELKILLRDKNLPLMDKNLTNGARAIPKLMCYDESYNLLGCWGARPKALSEFIVKLKKNDLLATNEFKKQIQMWYNNDQGKAFQKEFGESMLDWENKSKILRV